MFSDVVGSYLDMLNSIEKNWDATKGEIIQTQKEQQDLLHEIELTRFDIQKGYRLAKRLQEVRQRRRKLKDKLEILQPLKDYHDKNIKQKIDLFKVQCKMRDAELTQKARTYTPKALKLAE